MANQLQTMQYQNISTIAGSGSNYDTQPLFANTHHHDPFNRTHHQQQVASGGQLASLDDVDHEDEDTHNPHQAYFHQLRDEATGGESYT
jgi:PIN domain nuclease of toxin-antitoxin system